MFLHEQPKLPLLVGVRRREGVAEEVFAAAGCNKADHVILETQEVHTDGGRHHPVAEHELSLSTRHKSERDMERWRGNKQNEKEIERERKRQIERAINNVTSKDRA